MPQDIVEELKNNAHQNKYLPMQGLSELRDAVAKHNSSKKDYSYKSENVIIGPGSKELMFLLHVIFDGEIILPAPSWVSYAPQAILGRNKVRILQTNRENNWFPSGKEIEEIILKDKNKNYLAFSGIGNHKTFIDMLQNNKLKIVDDLEYPDHYQYTKKDLNEIIDKAKKQQAKIITTEKDYLRLNSFDKTEFLFIKSNLEILNEKNFIKKNKGDR